MEFSNSAMKRIIKNQGDKRASRDAADELGREVEMYGATVAQVAIRFAERDGRKTVREEDIRNALDADLEEILDE